MRFSLLLHLACVSTLGLCVITSAQDAGPDPETDPEADTGQASESQSQESQVQEQLSPENAEMLDFLRDLDPEVRREVIKNLRAMQREGADLGFDLDSLQFSDPVRGGLIAAPKNMIREDEHGEPLYLPLGGWLTIELPEDSGVEFPFYADGPGVLTLMLADGEETVDFAFDVLDTQGRYIVPLGGNKRWHRGSVISAIPEAGDFSIRLSGVIGAVQLSAEWLPFPGLSPGEVVFETRPTQEDVVVLAEGEQEQTTLDATSTRWLSFTADQDGQAVIECRAEAIHFRLGVYYAGDFSNEQLSFERDLGNRRGLQIASFPAVAGQTYFIRVASPNAQGADVRIHPRLIPEPAVQAPE